MRISHLALQLSLVLTGLGMGCSPVLAQDRGWTPPEKIVEIGNSSPLIADAAGNLHLLFLAYSSREAESGWAGDTIYYMRWSNGEWSSPVDVLLSPFANDTLRMPALGISPDGYLHVIWYGNIGLYHSWVHANDAANARFWQTETLANDRIPSPDLAIDPTGTLHVVYSSEMRAVRYLQRDRNGQWTEPQLVWEVTDPDWFAVAQPQVAVDDRGTLHVGWTENARENDWGPESAWYSQSTDSGVTWSEPQMIATPAIGLDILIAGDSGQLWLVLWRGIGNREGRFYSYSEDAGLTWSEERALLPSLDYASGSTGGSGSAVDGGGSIHLVNSVGRQRGDQEVYHAKWNGDHWENSGLIDTLAEVPRVAITGGNRLHVVYSRDGIWYTTKHIEGLEIAPQPLPTPYALPEATIDYTPTPAPTPVSVDHPLEVAQAQTAMNETISPWIPVAAGVVPAFLVIAVTVLVKQRRRR